MYRIVIAIVFFCIAHTRVNAQHATQTIVFRNLNRQKGKLFIGWYDSADHYKKSHKAVISKIVEADTVNELKVEFTKVPPGIYAVAVFFDENDNSKMDTKIFGIPVEKYGFSNNVYPMFRAANFKEASFLVTEASSSQTIRLK